MMISMEQRLSPRQHFSMPVKSPKKIYQNKTSHEWNRCCCYFLHKLYVSIGVNKENIIMLDSKGVISKSRTDLDGQKKFLLSILLLRL